MCDFLVGLDHELQLLTDDEYLKSRAAPTMTNTTVRASLNLAFTMATSKAQRRSG